jgi:hypothetical protein
MSNPYDLLDSELNRLSAVEKGFGMLLRTSPYELPQAAFEMLRARHDSILAFQRSAIELFYRKPAKRDTAGLGGTVALGSACGDWRWLSSRPARASAPPAEVFSNGRSRPGTYHRDSVTGIGGECLALLVEHGARISAEVSAETVQPVRRPGYRRGNAYRQDAPGSVLIGRRVCRSR